MGFGGGYSESSQESQASKGLMSGDRANLSGQLSEMFPSIRQFGIQQAQDPLGLQYMDAVQRLMPTGPLGMSPAFSSGLNQIAKDLFGSASAARANRGGMAPSNLEGVVGDAIRMAAGQLAPWSTQMELARAGLAPQAAQSAMGFATTPFQLASNAVSGAGESAGSANAFGFNANAKLW